MDLLSGCGDFRQRKVVFINEIALKWFIAPAFFFGRQNQLVKMVPARNLFCSALVGQTWVLWGQNLHLCPILLAVAAPTSYLASSMSKQSCQLMQISFWRKRLKIWSRTKDWYVATLQNRLQEVFCSSEIVWKGVLWLLPLLETSFLAEVESTASKKRP